MTMNTQDLCAMQECLVAYKKLLTWLPVTDELEAELKENRFNVINHLVQLCGKELDKLSEEYQKE